MQAGDRIRVGYYINGHMAGYNDYTVELFRYCLGIFPSNDHREASKFTPLCDLYERGAYSEKKYISNFGEYHTNLVQAWMDIP